MEKEILRSSESSVRDQKDGSFTAEIAETAEKRLMMRDKATDPHRHTRTSKLKGDKSIESMSWGLNQYQGMA